MATSAIFTASNLGLTTRAWAEIDLSAIKYNLKALQRHFGPGTGIMAVVKANAYGLGAVEVARAALEAGAVGLVVTTLEEGVELRRAGLKSCPVLVLGPVPPALLPDAVAARLTLSPNDPEALYTLSRESLRRGVVTPVHLKLETGLHRNGLEPEGALEMARLVTSLPGVTLEGLYSHFATGDEENPAYVYEQYARYRQVRDMLAAHGFKVRQEHLSSSAPSIMLPEVRGKLTRIGLALMGYYPSEVVEKAARREHLNLKPSVTLKSTIARLHWMEEGETVGYGRTFQAEQPTRLALVPVGYADGYRRALSNRGEALVNGRRAPVVGRVSMDQLTLDVTGIPGVQTGDEVVLIGAQGSDEITLEEVASLTGTISYEILTGLGNRVKRIYLG